MFKHLLVAFDDSAPARRALDQALRIAADAGGKAAVTALLVVPDYTTPLFVEATLMKDRPVESLHRSLSEAGMRRLRALLAQHGEAARHVEPCVRVADDAHVEIVAQAERLDCDLIVMGTRGRGPLPSALLGGQTVRVLAAARRPVLVVP